MDKITISKKNEVFLTLKTEVSTLYELDEYFSFYVPGFRFMPLYKSKVWDGKCHLVNIGRGTLYVGLFPHLITFCKERDYELVIEDDSRYGTPTSLLNITPEMVVDYAKTINAHSKNKPLSLREYQKDAVYSALKHKRHTIISPTASGKSFIIYLITRYLIQHQFSNVLIVVPTKSLVLQMKGDFEDYSSHNGWNASENIHLIMGGYEKDSRKKVTISTWQSIYKQPREWFDKFQAVMVDECHTVQAKALTSILEKMHNTPFRYGFTGSLNNSKTHSMMIQAVLGPILKVASTSDLIDQGYLANIKINAIRLKYPTEITKGLRKAKYHDEMKFITSYKKRNNFIRNLALTLNGNTLILYTLVENHGKLIYDAIKEKTKDREVHFIHGGVEAEDRDSIRNIVENSSNAIIVASVGTFSTGINIKKLNNIIFASPTKSVIRVLQSIGRGLRKTNEKTYFSLYDIADDLSWKTRMNFTLKHFVERLKLYSQEKFTYKIVEVEIG